MSGDQSEFRQLLERIRAGSPEAVQQFLQRYGRHILTVIRQKLNVQMRSVFDSLDFLQDVWTSFFNGELDLKFHDPAALMRYLTQMARNKIADEARKRLGGGKFGFQGESSLEGSARAHAEGLADSGGTPAELAAAKEEWNRLLAGRPFHHVRILQMLGEGHTHDEIAAALGLNEKTVYRLIQKITARSKS